MCQKEHDIDGESIPSAKEGHGRVTDDLGRIRVGCHPDTIEMSSQA